MKTNSILISTPNVIRDFLNAVDGNWRQAAFIECRVCRYEKTEACGNFLCTVRSDDATPILLPEHDAEILFGRLIDRSECIADLSNARFLELYKPWIRCLKLAPEKCLLLEMSDG